jgi:hypothetical protein
VSPYPTFTESPNIKDPTKNHFADSPCHWLAESVPVLTQIARSGFSSYSSTPNSNPSGCQLPGEDDSFPKVAKRTEYETELLSHLPEKGYIDELVEIYFNNTDVCHSTFSPVFYDSYKKLFETPSDQPVNVPFLGVLFSAMANAVHVHPESDGPHAETARSTMELFNHLSNQITDHPQYNLHIETVEAILLQSMFLFNEVPRTPI